MGWFSMVNYPTFWDHEAVISELKKFTSGCPEFTKFHFYHLKNPDIDQNFYDYFDETVKHRVFLRLMDSREEMGVPKLCQLTIRFRNPEEENPVLRTRYYHYNYEEQVERTPFCTITTQLVNSVPYAYRFSINN